MFLGKNVKLYFAFTQNGYFSIHQDVYTLLGRSNKFGTLCNAQGKAGMMGKLLGCFFNFLIKILKAQGEIKILIISYTILV